MTTLLQYFTREELDPAQMQRKCMLIGSEFRMCPVDIAAFAAVGFLIFLVLWGIPMAVALAKWCKSKRTKAAPRRLSLYQSDIENSRRSEDPDSVIDDTKYDRDPYLSPTERLFTFLRTDVTLQLQHPPPAYAPPSEGIVAPNSPTSRGAQSADQMADGKRVADRAANLQYPSSYHAIMDDTVVIRPPAVYARRSDSSRVSMS
ncbi:hypothetical protein DAEQUDRAFT_496386 [Daedalea quercina L-15889]|uniref:Uncharacterized protein n=1 Tax=Daedalea quercina L-15889 TaxID=1314783 RepID=A0A165MKX6_9APHY|nr:hypothetical protein DAEQUDRAFT_496386 [Daedalea quercina L-15889]